MFCKLTNKDFNNKEERFAYIQANKESIVKSLKSTPKTKENNFLGFYNETDQTVKAIPNYDDKFIYAVISNTNYLDMHNDVHMNNSMNKTAKEQNYKVYYTTDHEIKTNNIIAMPEDVEVMIKKLEFKELNKDLEGKTQALIFKVAKDCIINSSFAKIIEKRKMGIQNSIRMIYVKADIGFNSDDEQFAVEKKYYDEAFEKAVNKEAFKDVDVVTLVRELKIHLEGSAVPFGSNDATLIKTTEAVNDDTSTTEPLISTQPKSIQEMLSKVSLI
jgi:hypothetical protein